MPREKILKTIEDTEEKPKDEILSIKEEEQEPKEILEELKQPEKIERNYKLRVLFSGRRSGVDQMFDWQGFVVANGTVTTVSNNADETLLESIELSGITWHVGQVIRVTANGVYSTVDATPTVIIRIGVGTAAPITEWNSMTSTAAAVTNQPWNLQFIGVVTAIGSSGTVEAQLSGKINNVNKDDPNTATVTFNTNTTQTLSISADWSAANASNSISIRSFLLEIIN